MNKNILQTPMMTGTPFPDIDTSTEIEEDIELREPPLYQVWLINDDYTSMDFVVEILVSVFNKSPDQAFEIMLYVHHQGQGLCGSYPHDIAATKVTTVHSLAEENGFPLKCRMEPV